ncbi:MAG: HD domain-containing protein [Clostridia bacterium]|nr:HD domain-containing protein [Clostridia bacterium]
MEFDSRALAVLNRLNSHGHEAYLVGGCVRDYLRNVAPHDYDATTSALPQEILAAFSDCPVIETGLKHGTVTVLWEGLPVEVTTYRVDGDYADGRHPDGVTFTRSLTEDLARRDFTVNAMAISARGEVIDPFGGQADLSAKVLHCVGDPSRRFTEDALRILRGLRFASVLGFCIEEGTAAAIHALSPRLNMVSAERICEEFVKLLCGERVFSVMADFSDVFGVFLPELLPCVGFDQHNFHHIYDVYTHLLRTVESVPSTPRLRMAALLHDIAKPETFDLDEDGVGHFYGHASRSAEIADAILRRLRFSNEDRLAVVTLIKHHDTPIDATEKALRRKLNKLGEEGFFDLLSLIRGDNLALAPQFHDRQAHYDRLETMARSILAEKQCFSLRDLAVNGADLMALGYKGREIGIALNRLLDGVLDGLCPNEKEALLRFLDKK